MNRPLTIYPFRGCRPPQWPFELNVDSPQAEGLALWVPVNIPYGGSPTNPGNFFEFIRNTRLGTGKFEIGQTYQVLTHDDTGDFQDFGDSSQYLPTQGCTIVLHYKKTDGTNRASGAFGLNGGEDANRCGVHLPYSDGVVYWDFGGTGAGNRLSKSGLSFGDDIWVFSTGARGMEIWQNGVLQASNASDPTRTSTTTSFMLGRHTGALASDLAHYGDFRVYDRQLPEAVIKQIFDPSSRWDLYLSARRFFFFDHGSVTEEVETGGGVSFIGSIAIPPTFGRL